MKKPIIAVDIDDVLVESANEIIQDYNRRWNTKVTLRDFYATHDSKTWGVDDEEMAIQRVDEYLESADYFALEPTKESIHALRVLAEQYELHILTGRKDGIALATKEWLHKYFPDLFASVNFSNLYNKEKRRSKGEMCRELGAQVLIDDHVSHVISAAEAGMEAVLFGDYPWNQAEDLPAGVTRCQDWQAVLEYFDARAS